MNTEGELDSGASYVGELLPLFKRLRFYEFVRTGYCATLYTPGYLINAFPLTICDLLSNDSGKLYITSR